MGTRGQSTPPAYANFEPAQTNPIRLSPDGTRLFAANSANNSLAVFDVSVPAAPKLLAEIPVGVGPVSVNPRTNTEVWEVNQVSNSVSIVSVPTGIVFETIQTQTEPMDVVFAGTQAYISCSRSNTIQVFDISTHSLVRTIPVFGDNPRALAVSPDGSTVYAAFALSGNATTIIPTGKAPPRAILPSIRLCPRLRKPVSSSQPPTRRGLRLSDSKCPTTTW